MRIESFLRQSPVYQLHRAAARVDASMNSMLKREDLTLFQALVLAAIFFEKEGVLRSSLLAETFQTTRANVSHCISSLEAKDLVRRKIDPEDARAYQLVLQPQGRKRAARVAAIFDRVQLRLEEAKGAAALSLLLGEISALEEVCSHQADSDRRGPAAGRGGLSQMPMRVSRS